jgi:hypothetical protein
MIGFISTLETSTELTQLIRHAQESRDLPVFWLLVGMPIYSGKYAGMYFIPADDAVLNTPLRGNPIQTPQDFPEFQTIIEELGGLDARVDLPPEDITE